MGARCLMEREAACEQRLGSSSQRVRRARRLWRALRSGRDVLARSRRRTSPQRHPSDLPASPCDPGVSGHLVRRIGLQPSRRTREHHRRELAQRPRTRPRSVEAPSDPRRGRGLRGRRRLRSRQRHDRGDREPHLRLTGRLSDGEHKDEVHRGCRRAAHGLAVVSRPPPPAWPQPWSRGYRRRR